MLKYERPVGGSSSDWTKTGECRVEQSVTDILQVHSLTVLAVEDEGTFDVIDVSSMQVSSHTAALPNIIKSYKTRII